ncbi:mRNA interferase RelE/StbE [Candidatus Magnetomoraceae bacterium gMMP-13]
MEKYNVILKPSVEKDLRKLSQLMIGRIFKRIKQLKSDPFPRQAIKLTGGERFYRIRVGDYRIVYSVYSLFG